jgi:16S rRNA (uracil1498-N3)-methyltransferase
MKQFLLPRWYAGQNRISISGKDYNYLARILRLQRGAALPAVDARGARYVMKFLAFSKTACEVEISPGGQAAEQFSSHQLTLLQCLPKGRKIDLIIRQATEAGVSRIVLVESQRSVARISESAGRMARLCKIAREALQQSGNPCLPSIEVPRRLASLREAPAEWGTALFFHEKRLPGRSLHELLAEPLERISILIGPEGGLSPLEVDLLVGAGFHPVCLGGRVLRVETAAIYAIAAVQTILQERDAWTTAHRR